MELNFSSAEKELLKEAFDTTDLNEDGMITTRELGTALRFLGLNPSSVEVTKCIDEVNKDLRGRITFEDFTVLMADKMRNIDKEEDIIDAFRTFDMEETGFISVNELRYVLTTLGETLKEQEINDLIKFTPVDDKGNIEYREFVKRLHSNE